jgi:hypothetical protein
MCTTKQNGETFLNVVVALSYLDIDRRPPQAMLLREKLGAEMMCTQHLPPTMERHLQMSHLLYAAWTLTDASPMLPAAMLLGEKFGDTRHPPCRDIYKCRSCFMLPEH